MEVKSFEREKRSKYDRQNKASYICDLISKNQLYKAKLHSTHFPA